MCIRKEFVMVLDWISLLFSMLWFSALVADGMAMTQGTYTCKTFWQDVPSGYNVSCNSSAYGITLALDAAAWIFLLFCWYVTRSVLGQNRGSKPMNESNGV